MLWTGFRSRSSERSLAMMLTSEDSAGPVVQLSAQFRAPCAKIYQCWTDPELLRKWFFVEEGFRNTVAEIDLRELGKYRLGMAPAAGGDETVFSGFYQEIVPAERLVYTWTAKGDPRY